MASKRRMTKRNRRETRKTRKQARRSRRNRRTMRGGFQDALPPMVTEVQPIPRVNYTSPFVTNMVRY